MRNEVNLRSYHPADLPDYYSICCKTGYRGNDATPFYDDPLLLGHIYVGPYLAKEPELGITALLNGRVIGYILGTTDSRDYDKYFRKVWRPVLSARYPRGTDYREAQKELLSREVWSDGGQVPGFATEYPSHLHIDILPSGQGLGLGRKLVEGFVELLVSRGVGALHFGVDPENTGALGFYQKLGFEQIASYPGVIYFGRIIK